MREGNPRYSLFLLPLHVAPEAAAPKECFLYLSLSLSLALQSSFGMQVEPLNASIFGKDTFYIQRQHEIPDFSPSTYQSSCILSSRSRGRSRICGSLRSWRLQPRHSEAFHFLTHISKINSSQQIQRNLQTLPSGMRWLLHGSCAPSAVGGPTPGARQRTCNKWRQKGGERGKKGERKAAWKMLQILADCYRVCETLGASQCQYIPCRLERGCAHCARLPGLMGCTLCLCVEIDVLRCRPSEGPGYTQ